MTAVSPTYIVVGAIVAWVIGWVWFSLLFPKVREELTGLPRGNGRALLVGLASLLVFAAALGTFLVNRKVLNVGDAYQVGFKIWIGFLLPTLATTWVTVRKSLISLVSLAGLWLVTTLVLVLLAAWMLPILER